MSMLTRNAIRLVARSAVVSSAATRAFSAVAVEKMNPQGIEISKAQRVAENGFVSGTLLSALNLMRRDID